MEKLYGGCKVHVGLRIPDPDSGSCRNIDIVVVTNKEEAIVISVQNNISGRVSIDKDDNWVCSPFAADDIIHSQIQRLPNPVAETEQSVCILEEYLQQRGVFLPQGYLSYRVICPNPNFRSTHSFPPGVITYYQWTQLQPEGTSFLSGWIKSKEKKMQESLSEKLNSVLSTAPVWDRLELKDDKQILGEFMRFKANNADILALRKIERSKVAHLTVEKKAASTVRISYVHRDYRVGRSSLSSQEVKVNSNAELVFRPRNSTNLYEVKLSTVVSLYLSV